MGSLPESTGSDHQQYSQQWKWFLSSCAWAATAEQGCSAPAQLDCSAAPQYDTYPCFSSYLLSPKSKGQASKEYSYVFTCYSTTSIQTPTNSNDHQPCPLKWKGFKLMSFAQTPTQLCKVTSPHAPTPHTYSGPKARVKRANNTALHSYVTVPPL